MWLDLFARHPVVPSLWSQRDIEVLPPSVEVALISRASLFDLPGMVEQLKRRGTKVLVQVDLLEGFGKDRTVVEYLSQSLGIDGIVTPNSNLIDAARREKILGIQRVFLHDSAALEKGLRILKHSNPDFIQLLPGLLVPEVLPVIQSQLTRPVMAAGFIRTKEQVKKILEAGVVAIDTSAQNLWGLTPELIRQSEKKVFSNLR